jgi:hypothetical protein
MGGYAGMSVIIGGDFLKDAKEYFEEFPEIVALSARIAINQVAERDGLNLLRSDIEGQIDFPAGYLKLQDRLGVTKKASTADLTAIITARDRATSLARFAAGQTPENTRNRGVSVTVKKGRRKLLKKAFLVRLKNGNIGLAIRLKQGETIANKNEMKAVVLERNVYLLYGPSVDQIFRTVVDDRLPDIGTMLSNQFFRQFARLSRG